MISRDAYKYIADKYQVQLIKMKQCRSMNIMREITKGFEKVQYVALCEYCAEVKRNNLESSL